MPQQVLNIHPVLLPTAYSVNLPWMFVKNFAAIFEVYRGFRPSFGNLL